jgi:hypothetical protein
MLFVHLVCLRTWLHRKENVRSTGPLVTSYAWKAYHCELCKAEFPDRVQAPDGRLLWLCEVMRPPTNYVVLESIQLQNAPGSLSGASGGYNT